MNRRLAKTGLASAITLVVSACAPVQQGNDQCKDTNINLLEITDAKYVNLPQMEGGLSAAQRAQIDATVQAFRGTVFNANGTQKLVNGLSQLREDPIAGCAVAITRDDQIAYLQGYGVADKTTSRPFTVATPAALGSIAKTLTALGTLVLVEQGQLDLDLGVFDQIDVVPGMDVLWADATLRQLLGHRAGFKKGAPVWDPMAFDDGPSMTAAFPNIGFPTLQPVLVFQGYKTMASNQPNAPGSLPAYSNVGYSVAGTLIDVLTGKPGGDPKLRGYEAFLWHTVGRGDAAEQPNMTSMCLATDFRADDIKNFAQGYAKDGDEYGFGDSNSNGWGWEGPAGGWTLTIGDLARLMLILQSDSVVDRDLIDDHMRQSQGKLLSDGTRAGLGLELSANGAAPVWFGKGGDVLGYTADFKIFPSSGDPDWGVAFQCNQQETGKGLTLALRNVLGGNGGIGGSVGVGTAPNTADPATVELVKRHEAAVRQFAERHLREAGSPERAWASARRELAQKPGGTQFIAAVEGGDYVRAARLLPTLVSTLR